MRDRLIELILNAPKTDVVYGNIKLDKPIQTAQTVADYLLANGVVVPPCKVGDKIYRIVKGKIKESEVEKIEITKNIIAIFYDWHGMGYELSTVLDLGKTVFLTREEAEQALKGGEG